MKSESDLSELKKSLLELSDDLLRMHNELDDKLLAAEGDPDAFLRIFMNEVMPVNIQLMVLMNRVTLIDYVLHDGAETTKEAQQLLAEDCARRYRTMFEKADYIIQHLRQQGESERFRQH